MSGSDERNDADRLRRWRLVLGGEAQDSCGALNGDAAEMDQALSALYDDHGGLGDDRRGGRGNSAPRVAGVWDPPSHSRLHVWWRGLVPTLDDAVTLGAVEIVGPGS